MTYTYKLARRLAISRDFGMLAALVLVAACTDDATGPESGRTASSFHASGMRVEPGAVTVETNQPIRFRAVNQSGETLALLLSWQASGGNIEADGTFMATEPGVYRVVGRGRGRGKPDTSTVVVVPRQPNVVEVEVLPDPVAVTAGAKHEFRALGRLSNGDTVAIGVTWDATGGTIDQAGVFTAGTAPGAYRVVATQASGDLSDTAAVTIEAPAEAPPEAPTPPAPTLAEVVLSPAAATITTGTSRQFAAYGRTSVGDSVAVAVQFSASGGSITAGGLYTAGSTAGTFRVVAATGGLADTATVQLVAAATGGAVGLPFGPSQQLSRAGTVVAPFTMSHDATTASNIVSRINAARSGGYKLLFAMTGGAHENYMSTIDGVLQFDEAKWRAKMDTYNTPTIRDAVARAVADGIIVGNSVMDEPNVVGYGDGNTWGPPGTMTKAKVDRLCAYVKNIFPSMAVGVLHKHNAFEPDKSYQVCEFIIDQYVHRVGDVYAFRDGGLALARRDGHSIMFSMNILNGGVQDRDGTWDCTGPGQGGKGSYAPNCRMTPEQIREWGLVLGPAGCGLFMWRYDEGFVADPANQRAFRDLAGHLGALPRKSCGRP